MHGAAKLGKCEVGGLTFPHELGAESFNSRRQTKPEELKGRQALAGEAAHSATLFQSVST